MRHFETVTKIAECFIVARIDIELFTRHLEFDGVVLARNRSAEINMDDVVAFGAPGDVVSVAEGVDLEGADVGWEKGEVLSRGGEHVPRVKVQEGHEEVKTDGRASRHDKISEDVITEDERGVWAFELCNDYVESGESSVGHDHRVDDQTGHEHSFGPAFSCQ